MDLGVDEALPDPDLLSNDLPPDTSPTAPPRISKRHRPGGRRDVIPRRIAAAHKVISQQEGVPAGDILLVDPNTGAELPGARSRHLCVLTIGGSSWGGDVHTLEGWTKELEGFVGMRAGKGKAYSFLTFATEAHCDAAHAILHCRPISDGRVCLVQRARHVPYADEDVTYDDPAEVASLVAGLTLIPDFITEEEEVALLADINREESPWVHLSSRKVQHYGIAFDYTSNEFGSDPLATHPRLPAWCDPILARLEQHGLLTATGPGRPNQLTVNHYPPGSGIRPHVDTHSSFDGPVVSVSLVSRCVMEFRYLPEPPRNIFGDPDAEMPPAPIPGFKLANVVLPARSAIVMSGDARFGWEHSIRPRASDVIDGRRVERGTRVSLTFRTVRLPKVMECPCRFWWLCDVQMPGGALPERFKDERDRRRKWW
ncbi:Alkylated DNA repair protein alkB 8 [Irineochytrium annulatum]|nr:Alkylated DNA repair protein alkB 8 [Irineochytrium annulatum]